MIDATMRKLIAAVEAMDLKMTRYDDGEWVTAYIVPAGPWHHILGLVRAGGHDGCCRPTALPHRPIGRVVNKGEQMSDEVKTWYGPHACSVCGATIIKAAAEEGGAELDPPDALMRVYHRGAESGNVEMVYPQTWKPHVHRDGDNPVPPPATA